MKCNQSTIECFSVTPMELLPILGYTEFIPFLADTCRRKLIPISDQIQHKAMVNLGLALRLETASLALFTVCYAKLK